MHLEIYKSSHIYYLWHTFTFFLITWQSLIISNILQNTHLLLVVIVMNPKKIMIVIKNHNYCLLSHGNYHPPQCMHHVVLQETRSVIYLWHTFYSYSWEKWSPLRIVKCSHASLLINFYWNLIIICFALLIGIEYFY